VENEMGESFPQNRSNKRIDQYTTMNDDMMEDFAVEETIETEGTMKDQQQDLDATFVLDGSALRLAQRELSSDTEEHDVSWIAEPLQYKKNLGAAFEQAEVVNDEELEPDANSISVSNKLNRMPRLADPTPSKATVADKIARFEAKSAVAATITAPTVATATGIKVYLRTRPSTDTSNTIQIVAAQPQQHPKRIRTIAPESSNAAKFLRGDSSVAKEYEFTSVLGETATQKHVYECTVQPVLAGLFSGSSALVLCYGITNAGKTYTVTGLEEALQQPDLHSEQGLVPRAVTELVQTCANDQQRQLVLSYFEVYNEQIYDLLAPATTGKTRILMDTTTTVSAVSRHAVNNTEQGLALVRTALKARRSAFNRINQCSSRSHAVCKLTVETRASSEQEEKASADLWIVDLAGSERAKRTGGVRWQEAASINKSLMTLNRCLMALRSAGSSTQQPPYRDSKLTQLFGAHWTGNSAARTVMIVNVNPAATDFDETQHVLAYASAAKTVSVGGTTASSKSSTAQYGYNGRRLHKAVEPKKTGAMDKIKAVIRKLSPKRSASKRKATLATDDTATVVDQGATKYMRVGTTTEGTDSGRTDRHMDDSMQAMRRQYESIIENLKAQISSTPKDQANDNVRELLDTINECEDEMERMREQHVADLARTTAKYEGIIQDKHRELRQQDELVRQLQARVHQLESEYDTTKVASTEQKAPLERQLKQLQLEIEETVNHCATELQTKQIRINDLCMEVKQLQQELAQRSVQEDSQAAALLNQAKRRHTRHQIKHQEVVVDLPQKNRVLGYVTNNTMNAEPASADLSNESFVPTKWLKPRRQLVQDPTTGTFLRPRGRAPSGAEVWDENRGAWRISNA
jgi:Kinesin motor domain